MDASPYLTSSHHAFFFGPGLVANVRPPWMKLLLQCTEHGSSFGYGRSPCLFHLDHAAYPTRVITRCAIRVLPGRRSPGSLSTPSHPGASTSKWTIHSSRLTPEGSCKRLECLACIPLFPLWIADTIEVTRVGVASIGNIVFVSALPASAIPTISEKQQSWFFWPGKMS